MKKIEIRRAVELIVANHMIDFFQSSFEDFGFESEEDLSYANVAAENIAIKLAKGRPLNLGTSKRVR